MKRILVFLCLMFCMAPSVIYAGTAHYVDPSSARDGDGTYTSPWRYLSSVNAHTFNPGDDLYFKVGTTLVVPAGQFLDIDWAGKSGDWVTIGAYYGDGLFGLNGNARPIIDGNNAAPAMGSYAGLINKKNWSTQDNAYLEVKDLRIERSLQMGILIQMAKNAVVSNCYVYRNFYSGAIAIIRVDTATVDGNTVDYARYSRVGVGAAIEVSGVDAPDLCKNIIVSNNIVFGGFEGIGIYKYAAYVTVTGNEVYDQASYNIYAAASKFVTISDNTVYTSVNSPFGPKQGITVDSERADGYCFTGNIDIYGNRIANTERGITIAAEDPSCAVSNCNVYNNIIVDAKYSNFAFWGGASTWSNNNIYNNISYTTNNSTMAHSDGYSPFGIAWDQNNFDDAIGGNAAKNAYIGAVLVKKTGWNSLPAGGVGVSYFNLTNEGSAALSSAFQKTTTTSPTTLAPPKNLKIGQ